MLKNSETTTEFKLPRNLYFLLAGIVISLIPAMINGYPLVLTDTELYIQAGRELKTLEDRSFIYGWILVYSALKKSFFISIFFQSIIFNSVFFLFLQKQFHENAGKYFIYLILFLSLFTSLAWDVCYLMPDIFSSISLILIYLILVEKNKTRILVFAFMYVVFAQTHFS